MLSKTDLPNVPEIGAQFRPDNTDAIGTVTKIERDHKRGSIVSYTFEHAPEVTHTRPWSELRTPAWAA